MVVRTPPAPRRRTTMAVRAISVVFFVLGLLIGLPAPAAGQDEPKPARKPDLWRALHLLNYNTDKDLETLGGQVPKLAELGLNVIILEIDYNFRFQAYPKLRQ